MSISFAVSPGSSRFDAGRFVTGVIEATAHWCEALQGGMSLADALESFVIGLGAEAGMLVRTDAPTGRAFAVATVDRRRSETSRPLCTSYAEGCFGHAELRPRRASLWLASALSDEMDRRGAAALAAWQSARHLTEFAVLVLDSGNRRRDHIELHFASRIDATIEAALAAMLPTMARTWSQRQVGLVSRMVPSRRIATAGRAEVQRPLLDSSNPTRLSRAEFRVCLFLSRGLSVARVAADLGLSDATVRTHLRNIYAKTETSGLDDLMYRLLQSEATPQALSRLSA